MTTVEGERRLLGGRYELQERIANGGMGEVWRGRDVVLQRTVAIKVLRSEYADDPTFVARFRAEARNAAALNHPNIASVLDYGEAAREEAGEHLAFLVMELVEGAPLSDRLAVDGPMEPEEALSVLRQTAAGLAEAHRRGMVHRDVKPANILVRPDGAVKLTDFGIARSADSVPLTGTGQVVGTAQYMSPEQAKGEPATPASDVYALGLVGYESLTGHAAFAGENPITVALKHVVEEPEPLPAELPEDVRDLIDSALAKDPEQRIPDGAAFLDAARDTLDHEGAREGTAGDTRPVRVPAPRRRGRVSESVGATRLADADAEPRSRRRTLLVLLPVLALVVAAGVAALVLGGPGGGRSDSGGDAASGPSVAADPGIVLTADDFVGRPYDEVADELTGLGLTVVRVEQVTADRPAGTVTAIAPAGTRLDAGDEVRVTAAVSPPEEALPEAPASSVGTVGGGRSAPVAEDAPAEAPATGEAPTGGSVPEQAPATQDPVLPTDEAQHPTTPPAPDEPEPSTPAPVEPEPSEPAPTEPEPSEPTDGGTPEPTAPETGTAETGTATADPSVAG